MPPKPRISPSAGILVSRTVKSSSLQRRLSDRQFMTNKWARGVPIKWAPVKRQPADPFENFKFVGLPISQFPKDFFPEVPYVARRSYNKQTKDENSILSRFPTWKEQIEQHAARIKKLFTGA